MNSRSLFLIPVLLGAVALGALAVVGDGSLRWGWHVLFGPDHGTHYLDQIVATASHGPRGGVRVESVATVAEHMDEAWPLIRRELVDVESPGVALPVLAAHGPSPDAAAVLIDVFRDDRGAVSFQAGRALGWRDEPEAAESLVWALCDGSARQRRAALAVVRAGRLPQACPVVAELLQSPPDGDARPFDRALKRGCPDQPRPPRGLTDSGDTASGEWSRPIVCPLPEGSFGSTGIATGTPDAETAAAR